MASMAPPSPTEPGGRDAPDPDGDDVSLSTLAKKAYDHFKAHRYDECLTVLEDLRKKRENDPKKCLQAKSEELARTADEQVEGSGTTSGGQAGGALAAPAAGISGNAAAGTVANGGGGGSQGSGSGGAAISGGGAAGSGPTGSGGPCVEEYDMSIPTTNKAVMLFHLQQFGQTVKILEPLSHNLEPLDEDAALRVCWLLLDTWLASRQPEKAAPLLAYAEKVLAHREGGAAVSNGAFGPVVGSFPGGSSSSGGGTSLATTERMGTSTQLSAGLGSGHDTSLPSDGELGGKGNGGMNDGGIDEDVVSSLELHGSSGLGSRPGSAGSTSGVSAALPMAGTQGSVSGLSSGGPTGGRGTIQEKERKEPVPYGIHDLKLNLHMYRARLLMLVRNLKATKREVKLALNLVRDHMPALLLKAQLEYCRGNFRKAIKLLTTCFSGGSPGDSSSVLAGVGGPHLDNATTAMLLSNLGCIHFRLGKHRIASVYFLKALEKYMAVGAQRPLSVGSFTKDKVLHVLYNMGIQQLHLGNPLVALRCLQESGRMFYNRPLLWLRLAECCISAHGKGLLEDRKREQGSAREREEVVVRVVGEERWRQVLLPAGGVGSGGARVGSLDVPIVEGAGEGDGQPEGAASAQGDGGGLGTGEGGAKAVVGGVPLLKWDKGTQQGLAAEEGGSAVGLCGHNGGVEVRREASLEYASECLRIACTLLDRFDSRAAASAAAAVALAEADPGGVMQNAGTSVQGQQSQGMQHQQSGGGGVKTASSTVERRTASLVPSTESKDGKGVVPPAAASAVTVIASAVAGHEDDRRMELSAVRQCVLANLAYVELFLENPVGSLAAAERLLAMPECSRQYSFLGHMYAAEALCILDRPTLAAEHLATCMLEHTNLVDTKQSSSSFTAGGEEDNAQKWKTSEYGEASMDGSDVTAGNGRRGTAAGGGGGTSGVGGIGSGSDVTAALSGMAARASLYVNLAAVYALQGELLQAQQCALQALKISPTNPVAILAVVYVELSRGHKQDALDMLKHCRNIKCLWGGGVMTGASNAAGAGPAVI